MHEALADSSANPRWCMPWNEPPPTDLASHPAGREEAGQNGTTLFAGFAGAQGKGCCFRPVAAGSGKDVWCRRRDQAPAAGRCLRQLRPAGSSAATSDLPWLDTRTRCGPLAEKPDLTIPELGQKITAAGSAVGRSAVGRFALATEVQKNPACRRAGAPGRQGRSPGTGCGKALIPKGLFSSPRPRPRPT